MSTNITDLRKLVPTGRADFKSLVSVPARIIPFGISGKKDSKDFYVACGKIPFAVAYAKQTALARGSKKITTPASLKLADTLGRLIRGMTVLDGEYSNEGRSRAIPFHIKGTKLSTASIEKIAEALGLKNTKLIYDLESPHRFYKGLKTGNKSGPKSVNAAKIEYLMNNNLKDVSVVILGDDRGPWDSKTLINALMKTNGQLFRKYLGSPVTPQKIYNAIVEKGVVEKGKNFKWLMVILPVLIIGTARDGSISGLLTSVVRT